jgi:putative aldouronate transport system substrate-binding protein
MIKKRVGVLGLTALLAFTLIGCSNNNNSSSSSPSSAVPSKTSAEPSKDAETQYTEGNYTLPIVKEPIEIVWMGRDSENAGKSFLTNKTIVWEQAREKTGISIKWDVVPNAEYKQIMQMRLGSKKDLPEILMLSGDADGSYLIKYAEDGVLIPLNDLIDKYAPNLKKMLDDNPAYKQAVTLPNGEIVALGNLNASTLNTKSLQIRKDWLDKLNIGEVKSPEDLMNAAKAFVNNDPNGNSKKDEFGIMGGGINDYRQIGTAFGLSLVTGSGWSVRDGKVTYEFIIPEYKAYLEWMNKAYNEGLIPKDFQTATGDVLTERNSKNLLGIRARDSLTEFVNYNNPENTTQKNTPGAVWMPINFENEGVVYPMEAVAALWRTYGITSNAKDPIAAIRLLDYVVAGEGQTDMLYGIEGVTYNLVNGKPVSVDNLDEVIGSDKFMGSDFAPKIYSKVNQEAVFEQKYLNNDTKQKDWSIAQANAVAAKATAPFQPPIPTAENAATIANLFGDLNTYRDEMYVKFITGETKLSDFDKYVSQMKELGADKIAALYQEGYDKLNK